MAVPLVMKSVPFLSGVGVVGAGGSGVIIWQAWERNNPTGDRQLTSNNYSLNPPSKDIGAKYGSFGSKKDNQFLLKNKGCFDNFFPGADISKIDEEKEESSDDPDKEPALNIPYSSDVVPQSFPVGCALLQFSYKDKNSFVFKSEITVKNDKIGWVLWTGSGGEGVKEGETTTWQKINNNYLATQYRLLFLSMENDKWEVKGGYDWYAGDSAANGAHINIHIFNSSWIPDTSGNVEDSDTVTTPFEKKYFGIWELSPYGQKEVFQDIQLWLGPDEDRDKKMEILGRVKDFDDEELENKGFDDIKRAYKPKEGWVTYSKTSDTSWAGFDATEVLKNWYSLFKNKHGTWYKLDDDFCTKSVYERNPDPKTLERFKHVCYSRKTF